MFYNCHSLTSLDLNNFNTELVEDIAYMFYECKRLSFINLKSFNTLKVTSMDRFFCSL